MTSTHSRTGARHGFDIPVRVSLAESDLDDMDHRHDALAEQLARLTKVATGILVSLTTSSIFLAIQIVTQN